MQVAQHTTIGGDSGFDGGVSQGNWPFNEPAIADLSEPVPYAQQIQSPSSVMMAPPANTYQFDPSHVAMTGPQYVKVNPQVQQQQQQQQQHGYGQNGAQYAQQAQPGGQQWSGEYNNGGAMAVGGHDYSGMQQSYVQGGQPTQHWQNPGNGGH